IPALVISFDRDYLYPAAHLTMLVDPDVPYALQVQPMLAGGRVPPAAVPIRGPLHGVEPARSLEPWESRSPLGLDTSEERVKRPTQPTEGGLLGGERPAALSVRIGSADVAKLSGLLAVAHRYPTHPPSIAPLLQGGVVQLSVVIEHRGQRGRLAGGRP